MRKKKPDSREAISKRLTSRGLADVTKEELDRFKKRRRFTGSNRDALRMFLNEQRAKPRVKATDLDDPLLKPFTKKDIGARRSRVASDTKAAQDKLARQKKTAGTIVGGALAAVPTAGAGSKVRTGLKAVGGTKGVGEAARRTRGMIEKEMKGRRIGAGRKTTGDLLKESVQQFTKTQPALTKRRATIAAKRKKKEEAAAKRKQERSVDTRVKRLDKGSRTKQFSNRAEGGMMGTTKKVAGRRAGGMMKKMRGGGMMKKMRGGGMIEKKMGGGMMGTTKKVAGKMGGGMMGATKKVGMKKGGQMKTTKKVAMKKSSIDGIARKGKTRGRIV